MFLTSDNKIIWKDIGIVVLVVVALCMAGIWFFDQSVFMLMRALDGFWARGLSQISNFKFIVSLSGILFFGTAVLRFWRRRAPNAIVRAVNITAMYVLTSVVLAGVITGVLKILIGRMRPIMWEALGQTGFFPGMREWVFNSMPSGHVTASVAAVAVIGLLFPRYKIYLWTVAALVAVSRVAIGAHWPSDVILGALIGVFAAVAVRSLFAKLQK